MYDKTTNKLIGKYISGLGPEVQSMIKEMYNYRYAPRPEGMKPPKGYPIELEKEIIDVLTIALQNRRNFLTYQEQKTEM